ncbi:hypothetical protein N7495_007666 [Penicillium taxi]|uniref:uncharacterized protein n=1 Tax=Penicillium taxi TaxID=168475 RepID=UPI0025452A29|nr:uncharacterized protein N7495_007666 [Penicillium taxi]KAJ5887625.1 hypothetical protein N7495_007666 [Penicillium taxi]
MKTVRVRFYHSGLQLKEDIRKKGLDDVIFDAITLHDLTTQHHAQYGGRNVKDASLVDFAVLEVFHGSGRSTGF